MVAAVTDPVALEIDSGERFLSDLRTALDARPEAERFLIGAPGARSVLAGFTDEITVAGVPVSDTCKEVVGGRVRRTVPREDLVSVTGPWLVTRTALTAAVERVGSFPARNPLELFRHSGLPIRVDLAL